jgi:hypothetical protein
MNMINPNAPAQRSEGNAKPWIWSIGIYAGKSPLRLAPAPAASNPVLCAADVTDVPARFVADPFMLKVDGLWHMFFEVLNHQTGKGEIGLAISPNGLSWRYQRIVLREPFHLSYPSIFRWNDDFYMIPETLGANSVRLYRSASFPDEWSCVKDLIPGQYADPSIFCFEERWWLFTCPTPHKHNTLRLYSAADPASTWKQHPCSPIIAGDRRVARPGGRVLAYDGKLVRFAQDCYPTYGKRVRAFEISELTATAYKEHEAAESPVISPGSSAWNASGMHHVDAHRINDATWLACVDGLADS